MAKLLVVDDEKNLRRSVSIALREWDYKVDEAASGEEALALIENEMYDLMLTDLVMEPMDGLELLKKVRTLSPNTEVLLMSAHGTVPKAVEAMKFGAGDFIIKPFGMDNLKYQIERLLKQHDLKETVRKLQRVVADKYSVDDMVAVSPGMREVMNQIAIIADWKVPVLIQGESGVGKELVAMAIHHLSSRRENPFVPINCGAFSETLLDSELFGHCKGAFTGAVVHKTGLIEESNGGTLLLDEIGEAPQALQVRLLRFLDNGRFRRIGEVVERESDVRILAATNRDLKQRIKEGSFREDLFYRITVAVVKIPPLRERPEDIPVLTKFFIKKYCKKMELPEVRIHPAVMQEFLNYSWPGNVRELENTIEHALIVSGGDMLKPEYFAFKFSGEEDVADKEILKSNIPLQRIEKKYILSVLERCKGNKKKTAEILNISRTTLISKLKKYDEESEQ